MQAFLYQRLAFLLTSRFAEFRIIITCYCLFVRAKIGHFLILVRFPIKCHRKILRFPIKYSYKNYIISQGTPASVLLEPVEIVSFLDGFPLIPEKFSHCLTGLSLTM